MENQYKLFTLVATAVLLIFPTSILANWKIYSSVDKFTNKKMEYKTTSVGDVDFVMRKNSSGTDLYIRTNKYVGTTKTILVKFGNNRRSTY